MQELNLEDLDVAGGKITSRTGGFYRMVLLVMSKRDFGHTMEETVDYMMRYGYGSRFSKEDLEEFVRTYWVGLNNENLDPNR